MKWRKIICIMLSLLLLGTSIYVQEAFQVQAQNSVGAGGRETLNFNTDWLYSSMDYENGDA